MLKYKFLSIGVLISLPINPMAAEPQRLFDKFWSAECIAKSGKETGHYTTFEPSRWCINQVDTFRVQSHCQASKFSKGQVNRVNMELAGGEKYIIEFTSSSIISVMLVEKKYPLVLKQVEVLSRAFSRKNLQTHFLYCP